MNRKYNNLTGIPIFNDMERALLHAELISRPCKVCGAKTGFLCRQGKWNGTKSVYNAKDPKMEAGRVHMGRLPAGFDSEKAVDEALKRMKGNA
jgi:hypothetical protein